MLSPVLLLFWLVQDRLTSFPGVVMVQSIIVLSDCVIIVYVRFVGVVSSSVSQLYWSRFISLVQVSSSVHVWFGSRVSSHHGMSFTGSVVMFMNIDIIAPSASCAVMFSMLSPVLFCCSFVQWSSAVLMLQFVPVALLSPNTVSMP